MHICPPPPPHDTQLLLRRPRERAVEEHEVQRARANVLTDAEVQHVKDVEADVEDVDTDRWSGEEDVPLGVRPLRHGHEALLPGGIWRQRCPRHSAAVTPT